MVPAVFCSTVLEVRPLDEETGRFERQAGLVPREELLKQSATVIGVGAIGRQVALQLACLGIPRLQLIDFDTVETTNVSTQGYLTKDLGRPKVSALREALRELDPSIDVDVIVDRWRPRYPLERCVFVCVDSIATRTAIWQGAGPKATFWCDGRMLAETIRIVTAADDGSWRRYPETLFEASDAQTGACTARGVIYPAAIAAGLMLHQFVRWLRGQPIDSDVTLNLLASELVAWGGGTLAGETVAIPARP
jgi:hypothetical protein